MGKKSHKRFDSWSMSGKRQPIMQATTDIIAVAILIWVTGKYTATVMSEAKANKS